MVLLAHSTPKIRSHIEYRYALDGALGLIIEVAIYFWIRLPSSSIVMLTTQILSFLESLDLVELSKTKAMEGATDVVELGSLSSFMLSLRCKARLQHNSKNVGSLAVRVSWILAL